jgi:hypothetical protein
MDSLGSVLIHFKDYERDGDRKRKEEGGKDRKKNNI